MMSRHLLPSLVMGLLVGGCTVGTDYNRPLTSVTPEWNALGTSSSESESDIRITTAQTPADRTTGLWEQFSDETLAALLDEAIANNKDLKIAEARLTEARAAERGTFSTFFPQFDATAAGGRGKADATNGELLDTQSQAGINGTWELDVAGGNRRRHEAARAGTEAAQADLEDTRLSLLAEVATNYVRVRSLQQQETIVLKNLDMQRDTLKITKFQREDGVVSDLDVVRAEAQVNTTAARLPQIKAGKAIAINRLTVLTGLKIDDIQAMTSDTAPIPSVATELLMATPADIIADRPDVSAAERRLAQAAALRNAAFAEFFPKLTLAGFFGQANSDLFGSASPWSATINGLLPLLNFGAIRSQVDIADARQQQALFNYEQTILLAVEQTEDALSNYLHEIDRSKTLAMAATDQARAAKMANEQYKVGVADQLDVLVAEEKQLEAENELALSEAAVAENLVQLYRALGEDWRRPTPQVEVPQ